MPNKVSRPGFGMEQVPIGAKDGTNVLHVFGPYQTPIKTTGVLCADGKRRTVWHRGQHADSYFTMPGSVQVAGRTVAGFMWWDGSDVPDDEGRGDGTYKFTPRDDGANAHLLPAWPEASPRNSLQAAVQADQLEPGGNRTR